MKQATYKTVQTWRACELGGAGCLLHTDTIYADGRIEWSVKGTADGGRVDEKGTRRT